MENYFILFPYWLQISFALIQYKLFITFSIEFLHFPLKNNWQWCDVIPVTNYSNYFFFESIYRSSEYFPSLVADWKHCWKFHIFVLFWRFSTLKDQSPHVKHRNHRSLVSDGRTFEPSVRCESSVRAQTNSRHPTSLLKQFWPTQYPEIFYHL